MKSKLDVSTLTRLLQLSGFEVKKVEHSEDGLDARIIIDEKFQIQVPGPSGYACVVEKNGWNSYIFHPYENQFRIIQRLITRMHGDVDQTS